MAQTIKLFQPLEKVHQSLGIQTSQPKSKDRVSLKCYFFLMSMIIYLISSLAFFMFDGESVAESGDSFYQVSTQIASIFHLITYIREVPEIRRLIRKFEDFIQKSKLTFSI